MSDIRMQMQKAITDIELEMNKLEQRVDAMDQGIHLGLGMALGKIRNQIIMIEQQELNAARDTIEEALDNVSVYFYATSVQDTLEEHMDDAVVDAKDQVRYHLEADHGWNEDQFENSYDLIEELVQDRVREEFAEIINV